MSSVGADDCDAIALIGQRSVGSTALPKKRNFPHTCCMNFLPCLSSGGACDACVAYCFLAPYVIRALGYGACCGLVRFIAKLNTLIKHESCDVRPNP